MCGVFCFFWGGGGWKFVFVIFTKLIPRRIFFCIAIILVLMVYFFCVEEGLLEEDWIGMFCEEIP